ncbi:MAG: AMP-binding protein [Pseudomonadota bacterium]
MAQNLSERADTATDERSACTADPGAYHGAIAGRTLHWYEPDSQSWVTQTTKGWTGYAEADGSLMSPALDPSWTPWHTAFSEASAPFYRWFDGALTNAAFNEVDRHVLSGRGDSAAFVFEGDRWDPSRNDGRGGPVQQSTCSRRQLLLETVIRAEVLTGLGLQRGDRVAFNLPNIPEQIYYTEAAKRLGIIYTPVFGGFSAKTLSDRIHDAGAKVVFTADGGYRNAEVVPFKEAYADPALDNYLPLATALVSLAAALKPLLPGEATEELHAAVAEALAGEITLERGDVMRELGRALSARGDLSPELTAQARTAVARQLSAAGHDINTVVVVRHTGQDIVKQNRDLWSHDLVTEATERVLARAQAAGFQVADTDDILKLEDQLAWQALNAAQPALPVPADWPLFIIYTSGSTGKPKGVVHTHGGWLSGITHTMSVVFDAQPSDRLFVIADPGWITGQSYLIAAPLAAGITTIVAEGSPLFPHAGRFSSIIERHRATLFKAGSTFLKAVMTDPASTADMLAWQMSGLKVGTFCAEPVSPAVQQFAMEQVCARYINSYWATEHGGIVLSCPWDHQEPLAANAHTWPLPWIQTEVRVVEGDETGGSTSSWRLAEPGEKGELVITQPYPYLARTIWGDADKLDSPDWRGDLDRFTDVYFRRWEGELSYTQGDYARQHAGGALTLHGRSDDVINVSGHRIGTEEIEGAILRDKVLRKDSPLGNAVVVGAPHPEKGETPVAFVIPAPGASLGDDDFDRFKALVRAEKGVTAIPGDFLTVEQFPETRSGKYMRRTLRALLLDEPLGDVSTLRNPESVAQIRDRVAQWRAFGQLALAREIVQAYRYVRIEKHWLDEGRYVALLYITHPPVNALSERCLDELHTAITHLSKQTDLAGVIVSGAGNAFVAGADVRELLEIGEARDRDSAATPPNAAQTAFNALETLPMPVLAAINGPALGGGNELALACTYLIADAGARFGQPEINLGLLPGYGGTQRLPRRLYRQRGEEGLKDALGVMLNGRSVDADGALALGMIDEISPTGGVVAHAVHRLREYLAGEGPVVAAQEARGEELAQRESPLPFEAGWLDAGYLAQVVTQSQAAGRGASVERIVEAVKRGAEHGQTRGLAREAELFVDAVCDSDAGPPGIRAFLERRSPALPMRPTPVPAEPDEATRQELEAAGKLLPLGAAFYPGVTAIPPYQYGLGVSKRLADGTPDHGDPSEAERLVVFPTPEPGPNDALVYVLASELNFNDIWAITGIPVSPFDARDVDVQVTGSGGVAIIAALGSELVREGRLQVGQLVTIYSGQSELLSPDQGLDPMAADFRIQGYERNDGSHAQFLVVQGPQLHAKLPGLTLEQSSAIGLTQGTIHRALYRTLDVRPGAGLFVEGAATGTGMECLRSGLASGLKVVGMVSSEPRAEQVRALGGYPVNRKDDRWADIFTSVPDEPSQWPQWEDAGNDYVADARAGASGSIDYVVSHAGERAFPRAFQLLSEGGVLTFFGASSGYRFTFMGKDGEVPVPELLHRARLRAGQTVLVMYGPGADDAVVDPVAIEAIEAAGHRGARVAVLSDTIEQREFVNSLGFGAALAGVVSVEAIARRLGDEFDPPAPLAPMPDPFSESAQFKEAVRQFSDRTLKPIGSAIAPLLRNTLDRRGLPDVVFERAQRDSLPLSTSLVKPNTGRVIYAENMAGQRYTFYAPQVWMRQRTIIMPTAEIRGTHLNTSREFAEVQERVAAGMINVVEPVPVPFLDVPAAHQAMWENRHEGATYVAMHAIPRAGLKTRDDLYRAWAMADAQARGEEVMDIDTGSAGTLR